MLNMVWVLSTFSCQYLYDNISILLAHIFFNRLNGLLYAGIFEKFPYYLLPELHKLLIQIYSDDNTDSVLKVRIYLSFCLSLLLMCLLLFK